MFLSHRSNAGNEPAPPPNCPTLTSGRQRRRHLPTRRRHLHQNRPNNPRLTNIAILNAALREPIDSAAPPALVPDSTRQSGATLTTTWHLAGTATERDYLACTYTPPHLLLFDITGLTTCVQTITKTPATFTATCR